MFSSKKNFLEKFFNLFREKQQEILPKMAEISRDYLDRFDGWRILACKFQ